MKKIFSLIVVIIMMFTFGMMCILAVDDGKLKNGTQAVTSSPDNLVSQPTEDPIISKPSDPVSKPNDNPPISKPDDTPPVSKPDDNSLVSKPNEDKPASKPKDEAPDQPVYPDKTPGDSSQNSVKPKPDGSLTDDDLVKPQPDKGNSADKDANNDVPAQADRSTSLPAGVNIEIKSVITNSDGTRELTLTLSNSTYTTYSISIANVSAENKDATVNPNFTINYGSSECIINISEADGNVASVTLMIDEVGIDTNKGHYSGAVCVSVTTDTEIKNKEAWTMTRVLKLIGLVFIGLVFIERIVFAIVLFCNYQKDGMKRIWPWFVFLGGLWVFILYFVIISQFGIGCIDDIEDGDIDFKKLKEETEDDE